MSNVLRFRFIAVLFLLVFMSSTLFGQIFRNAPRRVERQPVERQTVERQRQPAVPTTPSRSVPSLSPAAAKEQTQKLTSEIKENPRAITENDLNRCQKLLLDAVNDLQRRLPREFDRETANDWSTTFRRAELRTTVGQKTPDS
jgi:chromatin segregation and condensation protein Rec8/ScpA/Scc1 (kleisin family)